MLSIKLLGMGCMKSQELKSKLLKVLAAKAVDAPLHEIQDVQIMMDYHIIGVPALLINDTVVCEQNIPDENELNEIIQFHIDEIKKPKTMKKILVPTDFSDNAANAYHYALKLAEVLEAKVKVVHIMGINVDASDPYFSQPLVEQKKAIESRLAHFVEKYPNETTEKGIAISQKVDTEVIIGYAAERIDELSRSVDLIVMGTTGEGGLLEKVFGSVSSHVAQEADCPVLLIPPKTKFVPFKNVLYASDYLSADRKMIKRLMDFNDSWSSMVHFVHVCKKEEDFVPLENEFFDKLFENGEPKFGFNMLSIKAGTVAQGLEKYGKENNIDLTVLVTKHRSFIQSIFHKSMTKEVVLKAKMPIMVMHLGD